MKKRSCFLFSVIFLLFFSCTNNNIEDQADYFPNAGGNWWEYQYSDSLTMRLELSGIDTISNKEVQKLIWNDQGDLNRDYLSKKETEIILYSAAYSWTAFVLAKLPLEEGVSWEAFQIIFLGDTLTITAHVEEKHSISVPAGEFEDCYSIYYENQSLDQPMRIYLAPDVGPVKFEYATGIEEELIDYEVE